MAQQIKDAVNKIPGGVEAKVGFAAFIMSLGYQFLMAYKPIFGMILTWSMIFSSALIGVAACIATFFVLNIFSLAIDLFNNVFGDREKRKKEERSVGINKLIGLESIPKIIKIDEVPIKKEKGKISTIRDLNKYTVKSS